MGFVYCEKCKVWYTSKIEFCIRCGSALSSKAKKVKHNYDDKTRIIYVLCVICSKKIDEDAKFCPFCGFDRVLNKPKRPPALSKEIRRRIAVLIKRDNTEYDE